MPNGFEGERGRHVPASCRRSFVSKRADMSACPRRRCRSLEDVSAVYSAYKCFFRGVKARSDGGRGHRLFSFAGETSAGVGAWKAVSDAARI